MKFSTVSSFLLLLLAASPCIAAHAKLYSVHPFDNGNTLHQVDSETGATSSSLPLIGASGFRALATHPETDVLYAINQANDLLTVDPATGIATRIGRTVDWISSIAFDCSGKLYGVSGNQGTPREALYDINTDTGAATQLCTIGSNDGSFLQGVAIAWHPVEGRLYYSTGEVTNASVRTYGNVETILEVPGANCPLNDIQIDLGVTGIDTDAHAMTFSKAQDTFLYSIRNQQYFQVDADGTSSSLATLEDKARAFAIVPSTCRGGGNMNGDPHVKKWDNKWFDFQGACDLVLLEAPRFKNGLGLTIHVRTTARYMYSYISSAAIQIGEETLEVSSWGDYIFEGVSQADLPNRLSSFPVSHAQEEGSNRRHKFEIDLGLDGKIAISSFKDILGVEIENASYGSFYDSKGLMGQFGSGIMLARDGLSVLEDPAVFGQEWQVGLNETMIFAQARAPQFPDVCTMPSEESATKRRRTRRLGETWVSRDAAEEACNIWGPENKERCIFDVLAMNDVEMAQTGF